MKGINVYKYNNYTMDFRRIKATKITMKNKFVRGQKNSTYVKMAICRKRAWVGVRTRTIQVAGAFEG